MNFPDPDKLAEAIRRGRLTAGDDAQLQAHFLNHPADRARWEDDLALNDLLRRLPDAPCSSNFTAQVLALAQQRGDLAVGSTWWSSVWTGRWWPKLATVGAIGCAGLLAFHQHQLAQRREIVRSIAELSKHTPGATLDVLQNFEAIERLSQATPVVDRELITALQ